MAGEQDNLEQKRREEEALAEEGVRADADVAKLAADLDDLKQTLLRRQADFDNYRKRIESNLQQLTFSGINEARQFERALKSRVRSILAAVDQTVAV